MHHRYNPYRCLCCLSTAVVTMVLMGCYPSNPQESVSSVASSELIGSFVDGQDVDGYLLRQALQDLAGLPLCESAVEDRGVYRNKIDIVAQSGRDPAIISICIYKNVLIYKMAKMEGAAVVCDQALIEDYLTRYHMLWNQVD